MKRPCYILPVFIVFLVVPQICWTYSYRHQWDPFHNKYSHFSNKERLEMLDASRKMFQFGYDNYMRHAFPEDELDPIHCQGRGPDYDNP